MSVFWQSVEERLTSVGMALLIGEPFFWLLGLRRFSQQVKFLTVKRVLVVRLDQIGDLVLFTPFLRELRHNIPAARITLVIKPSNRNLMERCPYVDEILTFDWEVKAHKAHGRIIRHIRAVWLAARHLWWRRFDLAISPRRSIDEYHGNFLLYLSGARWRVAYSERANSADSASIPVYFDRLLTHPINNRPDQHEVEHNLNVLSEIGGRVEDAALELWLSEDDRRFAAQILATGTVDANLPVIAIVPGTRYAPKTWPLVNFISLATEIRNEVSCRFVIIGGGDEIALGNQIVTVVGDSVLNLAGVATLRQTAAVLARCALVVSNCTGAMHLAAAMKIPVVQVSCHPRSASRGHICSPVRFQPWNVQSIVLQPENPLLPCVDGCSELRPHCITQVQVADVKRAVLTLLTAHANERSSLPCD